MVQGYDYVFRDYKHTSVYFDLPFCNSTTNFGFWLTTAFHSVSITYLILDYGYFDGLFGIFAFNISVFPILIEQKIQQLNEILKEEPRVYSLRVKLAFKDIVQMHMEFNE